MLREDLQGHQGARLLNQARPRLHCTLTVGCRLLLFTPVKVFFLAPSPLPRSHLSKGGPSSPPTPGSFCLLQNLGQELVRQKPLLGEHC